MAGTRDHWDQVYSTKGASSVSWYRPHLERSLELVRATGAGPEARIIDVGGGASTLVDDLLAGGYRHVAVADLSTSALAIARERLGARAANVEWLVGDITRMELPASAYDVWHDRAVFHFLTEETDRARYLDAVAHSVKDGGHVIVACFGPAGPDKCSGLPVVRYDAAGVHDVFGAAFLPLRHVEEAHETPWGAVQEFVYCLCRKERRLASG